jgi:hypothetical protein
MQDSRSSSLLVDIASGINREEKKQARSTNNGARRFGALLVLVHYKEKYHVCSTRVANYRYKNNNICTVFQYLTPLLH